MIHLCPRHPAKYTDCLIPLLSALLQKYKAEKVLDPFAGTGKIGLVKNHGFKGFICANDIESDWVLPNIYGCDCVISEDSEFSDFKGFIFDAIVTSPTYGNRMADHHKAKDGSRRNTYTHCIGHDLAKGNTGKMQWGAEYKEKHIRIYKNIVAHLATEGVFILNVSDHIRKGAVVNVSEWHKSVLTELGLYLVDEYDMQTPRLRFGANREKRVSSEKVYVFVKRAQNTLEVAINE